MVRKLLSILFSILWIGFSVWLLSAFVGLAIGAKVVSLIGWIILIALAIWFIRSAFARTE